MPDSVTTPGRGDIELVAVTKRYGPAIAVSDVSLRIPGGAYCCLLGPSGCGKTSTLRMIARHEEVSAGTVRLGGEDVTRVPPGRRGSAMMFQSPLPNSAAVAASGASRTIRSSGAMDAKAALACGDSSGT